MAPYLRMTGLQTFTECSDSSFAGFSSSTHLLRTHPFSTCRQLSCSTAPPPQEAGPLPLGWLTRFSRTQPIRVGVYHTNKIVLVPQAQMCTGTTTTPSLQHRQPVQFYVQCACTQLLIVGAGSELHLIKLSIFPQTVNLPWERTLGSPTP